MAELKKCPFCGEEAEVVKVHRGVAMFPYTVVCKSDECSASVGVFKETREEAIEAWNNRPTESDIRASVIDEFAEKLKAEILEEIYDVSERQRLYEVNSEMSTTCSHIMGTLRDVRNRIIGSVAEQLKGDK